MASIQFSKYQGLGNDFIALDNRDGSYDLTNEMRQRMCDRRFGIGADGILEIRSSKSSHFSLLYFNADGRAGSLCGNGCRCAVAFAWSLGIDGSAPRSQNEANKLPVYKFEASDGVHEGGVLGSDITENGDENFIYFVNFQDVLLTNIKIYPNGDLFLDTGSPHHVRFVSRDVDVIDVLTEGKELRYGLYGEKGSNINFVSMKIDNKTVEKDKILQVRTYERGVEDETLACGTGAVAVAISDFVRKLNYNQKNHEEAMAVPSDLKSLNGKAVSQCISTRGGKLTVDFIIEYKEGSAVFTKIQLSGYAKHVFDGVYPLK
ncbi:diaminopimelate epimerase-like [Physella acuta]|uniref:diaminopimelate epimerase-like n=1 Tax=Physella acuta TaxID=109671 RepID=UPI0027DDB934|nr:diaminopimelate epimerase-like [Physella acuta]XP_059141366.1 diaminopimelate epimerase-like [Physella acuta]XP_059141367.1 diaminopimelate epimerase-like [Physella acuta]